MGLFRRCHELSAPLSFPALAPDLGDLESVFDVFENGAGNDAIDTLIWDVRGQFMGVGDEVYVLPRLIVHTDIRGRVKGPGAMAGVALSRVSPCSIHREQAGDGCGGGLRRLLSVVTPFRSMQSFRAERFRWLRNIGRNAASLRLRQRSSPRIFLQKIYWFDARLSTTSSNAVRFYIKCAFTGF